MAEMAPGSAFSQENPYSQDAPKPEERTSPTPAAPASSPVIDAWKSDPEFRALPPDRQSSIVSKYFDSKVADSEFRALPAERQVAIKQKFISANLGSTGSVRAPVMPPPSATKQAIPTSVEDDPDIIQGPGQQARRDWAGEAGLPKRTDARKDFGFTPEQSQMFGPAARAREDIAKATGADKSAQQAVDIYTATKAAKQQNPAADVQPQVVPPVPDESSDVADDNNIYGSGGVQRPEGIYSAPEFQGPVPWLKQAFRDRLTAMSPDRAAMSLAMSDLLAQQGKHAPPSYVASHFDDFAQTLVPDMYEKPIPLMDMAMTATIFMGVPSGVAGGVRLVGGLMNAPAHTLRALGAWQAFGMAKSAGINALSGGKSNSIADLVLPTDASVEARRIMGGLETAGELLAGGALSGPAAVKARDIFHSLTKDVDVASAMPRYVTIDPERLAAMNNFQEVAGVLGLRDADVAKAMQEGVTIKVPATTMVRLMDKPWWGAVKSAFGRDAVDETSMQLHGRVEAEVGMREPMNPTRDPNKPLDVIDPDNTPPNDGNTRYGPISATQMQEPKPTAGGPIDLINPAEGGRPAAAPSEQPGVVRPGQPIAMPGPSETPQPGVPNAQVPSPEAGPGQVEAGAAGPGVGPAGGGVPATGPVPPAGPLGAGPVQGIQPEPQGQQPAQVQPPVPGPSPEGQREAEAGPAVQQAPGAGGVDAAVEAGPAGPAGGQRVATPGQEQPAGEPGRNVVRGRRRDVSAASGRGGEKFPAHYELRELGDLRASHNPLEQFRENPEYPQGIQDRPYATSQTHQEQVHERVAKFDPSQMVNTGPTAETGPSVVTSDGLVIGGNSRKMILDIITNKHPERYEQYLQALREEAVSFGLDPAAVDNFKMPVLVRALDFASGDKTPQELGRISGVLNKPTMTGQDKTSKGVAVAKGLTKKTLGEFARGLSGYDTLRAYLDSPHAAQKLVPSLESDGVLDPQNRDQYMLDGKITPEGKDAVEAAVRGYVVPDNELLQRFRKANADEMKTFDFALPHLAYAKAMGEEWISPTMSDVIRLFLDYNAHKVDWQARYDRGKKGVAIAGHKTSREYGPDFYLKQPTLPIGDIAQLQANKLIREQFRALVTLTPREFAAAWKGYADALRELLIRPTMPGITIDTGDLRKIVEGVMGFYDQTMDRVPRTHSEATGDPPSVSEKPGSETQPEKPRSGETQEPVLDLTEEDKREPWQMTRREFAGVRPSPPQIVDGKAVGGEGLKEWNAKSKQYDEAVAQAYRDGKLTLDEVRVKAPDQWLKLKGESQVKPPAEKPQKPAEVPPRNAPAVKPEAPAEPERPVFNREQVLADHGLKVTEKIAQKTGKPYWEISGKTFENKVEILTAGGRWGGKVWRMFTPEALDRLADALQEKKPVPEADKKPRGTGEVVGTQIKVLRDKLDAMPSLEPVQPEKSVGDAVKAVIRRGEGHIASDVLQAQIRDVGKIGAAFRGGRNAFVLASDPGMGKTFVIAGALAEIHRASPDTPLVWITQNKRLVQQIQRDTAAFGLGDGVHFLTYTDLSMAQKNGTEVPVPIDGAAVAWDEGHSVKNTSLQGEDAGAARADLGQKLMKRAKFNLMASATPFENPTQMGYIAASGVFDQITGMTGLDRAVTASPFHDFALAYGAGLRKIKVKGGREIQVLEWNRGSTPEERKTQNANAAAARNWLKRQGMFTQREMQVDPAMVDTSLQAVPAQERSVDIAERFTDAMQKAIDEAGDQRALRRNLAGYMTNTLKRIMEDAKVPAAIEAARAAVAEGKQAVIFVETRSAKEITGRDYPAMAEQMSQWNAERQMMGDAGKPPYSRFQMAVAEALHSAGLDEAMPSTVARLKQAFPDAAVYTGSMSIKPEDNLPGVSVTEKTANDDLDAWLSGKKDVLLATMAKGGTGLSLHSVKPGDPERVLIGLNLPWTATTMKQVLGRVIRLGMLKPAQVKWLFLDHDFERMIAAKVGGRMQDMGAVVSGKVSGMSEAIEAFDFDAPNEGDAVLEGVEDMQRHGPKTTTPKVDVAAPERSAEPIPLDEPLPASELDVAKAFSTPDALADLAKRQPALTTSQANEIGRKMAEGIVRGDASYDMEPSPYGGLKYMVDTPRGTVVFHEMTRSLVLETDPSAARAWTSGSRAKVTTDPRLIKRVLFKDILNQNPSRTVVSELFQNSMDAFLEGGKGVPEGATIEVATLHNAGDGFTVAFRDNGRGMTPTQVRKNYLAIGAKGKSGTDTVGGYGLAKVAFLFYPEEVYMKTTAKTKDGVVTTEIHATRDQFMDGDFPVTSRPATEDEVFGTTYVARMPSGEMPEGDGYYPALYDFQGHVNNFSGDTHQDGVRIITYNTDASRGEPSDKTDEWAARAPWSVYTGQSGRTFECTSFAKMPQVTESKSVSDGKNRVAIYFLKDEHPNQKSMLGYSVYAQVYSKGMRLPALRSAVYDYIDGIGIPGTEQPNNFSIAIDFLSTAEPESDSYPFLKNRTQVTSKIGNMISAEIKEYIDKLNRDSTNERVTEFRNMIDGAPIMGGTPVLIPKAEYPDVSGARGVVEKHEGFFSDYGKLIGVWRAALEGVNLASDTRHMITLDSSVYGWHAPDGLTGQGKIIALNPVTMLSKGNVGTTPIIETPEYKALVDAGETRERILASAFTHTALHEQAHDTQRGHDEKFAIELARLSVIVGHMRLATVETKAMKFYKEHADEIQAIADDLQRVREGRDAASGQPGKDDGTSGLPSRGVRLPVTAKRTPGGTGGVPAAEGGPVPVGRPSVLEGARLGEEGRGLEEDWPRRLSLSEKTDAVQAAVDNLDRSSIAVGMIRVVPDWNDLPADIATSMQRNGDTGLRGGVYALFDPDSKVMYLIASRLHSLGDVAHAVLDASWHENLHRGLHAWRRDIAATLPVDGAWTIARKRMDAMLNALYDAHKGEITTWLENGPYAGKFDTTTHEGRSQAAEEFLANEKNRAGKQSWWQKYVAAMRDWLRRLLGKLGFKTEWSAADTEAFVKRAHEMSKRYEQADLADLARGGSPVTADDIRYGRFNWPVFQRFKEPLTTMTEDERTFALQVWEHYDAARHEVDKAHKVLQDEVKKLAGVKHDSLKARLLDRAMLLYRDLKNTDASHVDPALRMPLADRIAKFRQWTQNELRTRKGDDKLFLQEFLRDLDASQNLTQEQKDFVDTTMDKAFRSATQVMQAQGKLKGQPISEYVFRKLRNRSNGAEEDSGAPAAAGSPVRTFSSALLRRKYPTLLDSVMAGWEMAPEAQGITNSWKEIMTDAVKIQATNRFIQDGMSSGVFTASASLAKKNGWSEIASPALKVWRPVATHKVSVQDVPGLQDVLAVKHDATSNYARRVFLAEPDVTWAVYQPGTNTRAAALFDNEMDARAFAGQFTDARVEYREQQDVFTKVPLYAPPRIAKAINIMTGGRGGRFLDNPFGRSLEYLNSTIKPWMLFGDFFHHQSLLREWTFSGPPDVLEAILHGAVRTDARGLPTDQVATDVASRIAGIIRGMRDSVSYRKAVTIGLDLLASNDPIMKRLVRKGLQIPNMADMTGNNIAKTRGMFETLIRGLGSQRAADAIAAGKILRGRNEHFLFGTLDAGLKALWAYSMFRHLQRRAMRAGTTPDVDLIAEQAANMANTEFGGQHLGREGRSKGWTRLMRLFFLAPDWFTRQIKPTVYSIPGLAKGVARALDEMPPPPGTENLYRRLLMRQILTAAAVTILMQMLLNWDSEEGPWEMYRQEFSSFNRAAKLNWTKVDITRFYHGVNALREGIGLDPIELEPGARIMLNMPGVFVSPLRLFELGRFLSAKGSPLIRMIEPFMEGKDWRDRPYKTVGELAKSVQHWNRPSSKSLVKDPRDENPQSLSQYPAIFMANVRDMQPLQVGQMLRWLQNEQDGLTAAIKSMGVDMNVARSPREEYQQFREIQKLSRESFGEARREIFRTGSFKREEMKREDAEAYMAMALRRMIHQTDIKAGQIRVAITEAKENPSYTAAGRREALKTYSDLERNLYRTVVMTHQAGVESLMQKRVKVTAEDVQKLERDLQ